MPSLSDDVLISESAVEQLQAAAQAAAPHETGGILLGVMGDDRRWVTAVREIPSAHPERGRYQLPANVTNGIVLEARALDPRIGYLGDWHSHPADSGASGIDLATYLWLLRHALSRSETTPLLVVVRRDAQEWQLDVTTAVAWRFRPRALAWSLIGDPSPPTRADDAAEGSRR
jgi:proteasome lid subunit RPN8/RPN11